MKYLKLSALNQYNRKKTFEEYAVTRPNRGQMKGCCPVHYKISHRNAQMEKIFSRDSIGGMRNTLIYVIGLVVIVGGLFYLAQDKSALSSDYKNIEYTVDKKPVQ